MADYLRGQIAKMADINIETLRYYEKNQLIPEPERTKSGYRIYHDEILERLEFIKGAREAGMTVQEIRLFFSTAPENVTQASLENSFDNKIAEIDLKILKLIKMKELLLEYKRNLKERGICPVFQKYIGIQKINR